MKRLTRDNLVSIENETVWHLGECAVQDKRLPNLKVVPLETTS